MQNGSILNIKKREQEIHIEKLETFSKEKKNCHEMQADERTLILRSLDKMASF
jgi:hypothetical protein